MPIQSVNLSPVAVSQYSAPNHAECSNPAFTGEAEENNSKKSKAAKIMAGATALAGVVALGIAARRGHLGEKVQELVGGIKIKKFVPKNDPEKYFVFKTKPNGDMQKFVYNYADVVKAGGKTKNVEWITCTEVRKSPMGAEQGRMKRLLINHKNELCCAVEKDLDNGYYARDWFMNNIHLMDDCYKDGSLRMSAYKEVNGKGFSLLDLTSKQCQDFRNKFIEEFKKGMQS